MNRRYYWLLWLMLCALPIQAQNLETIPAMDTIPVTDTLMVDTLVTDSLLPRVVLTLTDSMPNAVVHQSDAIARLIYLKSGGVDTTMVQEIDGFRVQVYASNAQQQAKNEAIELQHRLEEVQSQPVYVVSEPPFWKVRIGNFLAREQANVYKTFLLQTCPDLQPYTYVVADKIIIRNDINNQ